MGIGVCSNTMLIQDNNGEIVLPKYQPKKGGDLG